MFRKFFLLFLSTHFLASCLFSNSEISCRIQVGSVCHFQNINVNINSVSPTSVTLSWTGGYSTGSYSVKYGTTVGQYDQLASSSAVSPFTVSGLTSGTSYYFVVVANNQSNEQSQNSSAILAIPGAAPDFGFSLAEWVSDPDLPLNLAVANGGAGIVTYSIQSGSGSIHPITGLFTPAGRSQYSTVIKATDQMGQSTTMTLNQLPNWLWTDGAVWASTIDSNNNLYIAGSFTKVGSMLPAPRFIAVDMESGNPKINCNLGSGFNDAIESIASTNDAIYVVGSFTKYKDYPAKHLAKLNKNCEIDTAFTHSNSGFDFPPTVIVADSGSNSLFIGGNFTEYRGVANSALKIAKIDMTTGNLDTIFTQNNSGFDGTVYDFAVNPGNNSLYVVGGFTSYRNVANSAHNLAKIDMITGNLDTTFTQNNSGFNSMVMNVEVNSISNSVYVGGWFSDYRGVANAAHRVAKLDMTTGNLDTTFTQNNSGFDGNIYAMAISTTNNSLYIGGQFTGYRGVANSAVRLAKIDLTSGNLDTTFTQNNSGMNQNPEAIIVNSDNNSIYTVGQFSTYRGVIDSAQLVAKIDMTSGDLDTTFTHANSGLTASALGLAKDTNTNTLYLGGYFTSYRGTVLAQNLAKINLNTGTIDTTFTLSNSGFNSTVLALDIHEAGNSIYVGGAFTAYRGVADSAHRLAKLDLTTGNLDTTFTQNNSVFNGAVTAMVVHGGSNSLYVTGDFVSYRGVANSAHRLAKLDLTTGNLDTTFTQNNSGLNLSGSAFAIDTGSNSLYVGGDFTGYRGVANSAHRLAKLDLTTGNLDTTFTQNNSGFESTVSALAINVATNSLYVGGWFNNYRGVANAAKKLAKVDLTTGNLDTTFTQNNSGLDGNVSCLEVDSSSNSLLVGGWFDSYRGLANSAKSLAKLDLTTGNLDTIFTQSDNGFSLKVITMTINPNNQNSIYLGGEFQSYRNQKANYSTLLNRTNGDFFYLP